MHPLHVTLISLNKDTGSDTVKMLFRMYYDDFLLDYKLYQPDFESGKTGDPTDYFGKVISSYFNERVQVYINGNLTAGTVSELSINNYEVLMSLTYRSVASPKSVRIRNRILTAVYSDQTNMIYLNIDKYENALKLTVERPEATVQLK